MTIDELKEKKNTLASRRSELAKSMDASMGYVQELAHLHMAILAMDAVIAEETDAKRDFKIL